MYLNTISKAIVYRWVNSFLENKELHFTEKPQPFLYQIYPALLYTKKTDLTT